VRSVRHASQFVCSISLCEVFRCAQDDPAKKRVYDCTKILSEIRNPLNWLPRHGNRCMRMHAENPVRNLVKHIKSQFCWETPSIGAGASERQCTI
jgi:uncharacterized cysteine cluster protein YcgN (CxxCxxCC family)